MQNSTQWPQRLMNSYTRWLVLVAAALLLLGVAPQAHAITYAFGGTLDGVYNFGGHFPADVTPGTPFSGIIEWYPGVVPDIEPDPDSGQYTPAFWEFSVTMGSLSVANPYASQMNIQICDTNVTDGACSGGPGGDSISFSGNVGWIGAGMSLSFWDPTGDLVTGDAMPDALSLDGWESVQFIFQDGAVVNGPASTLGGAVTYLAQVPEPGTALLMGLGLIGLTAHGKRTA